MKITSKFDQTRGYPRTPGKASMPGAVANHESTGHMKARQINAVAADPKFERVPLGTQMGTRQKSAVLEKHTDRINPKSAEVLTHKVHATETVKGRG